MTRFLLGIVVGAACTAAYLSRRSSSATAGRWSGRVDELSGAEHGLVADPEVNAGDGTPSRATPSEAA
jgi:hypothetical protein